MIVTLTANPSIDRTAEVPVLTRGSVLRASGNRIDAGGKGVNVSRALAANGRVSTAVLPVGGVEGTQLLGLLEAQQLRTRPVPIAQPVRVNLTIVEPDGVTTKVNEPGPHLSATELRALELTLLDAARAADWVVLSGSLPPGASPDFYARLIAVLHELGVRVALDASGAALREALPACPDLVKPNRRELAEASGVEVAAGPASPAAQAAVAALTRRGAQAVLASFGPDGALLAERSGSWVASTDPITPRSTVGAGDAMLAGFIAAGGRGPAALAEAVAWGTAATRLPGSRMPRPADIERASVTTQQLSTLEAA